jgi:PAS domain S-box-containing protein
VIRRDGSKVWMESVYRLVVDKNGNPTMFSGVSRNISERRKVEAALQESLEKFRIIATHTPDTILVQDRNLRYVQVINPMPGNTKQDMLGHTDYEILSKDEADTLTSIKRQVMESGTGVRRDITHHSASGEIYFYSGSYVPKRNIAGEIDGLIGYFTNVTETKRANERILAALAEKETLIREIHHRVKNNLQIVFGLLYMTTKRTQDKETAGILTDMMMKIKTMAQIHTRLYESEQFDKIDMSGQIQDQVTDLASIYGKSGPEITCRVDTEQFTLPVEEAIPCALVINEGLSNAFKHAFRGRRKGTLCISAYQRDGNIHIRIEDNGIGIPKGVDVYNTTSLGMKLIRSLVHQLEGTLAIESTDRGSSITVDFPVMTKGG